jgi:hypothetical protein
MPYCGGNSLKLVNLNPDYCVYRPPVDLTFIQMTPVLILVSYFFEVIIIFKYTDVKMCCVISMWESYVWICPLNKMYTYSASKTGSVFILGRR